MVENKSFGQQVKWYRCQIGITQSKLAELTGYSISAIRKIEVGLRHPSTRPEMLEKFAVGLRIPPSERQAFFDLAKPPQLPHLLLTDSYPSNLPAPLTSLIGREQNLATLCDILRNTQVRLLTLTGPGGIGKTQLALRIAEDLVDAFKEGVFFVALASLTDPALLIPALMQTLEIREIEGQPQLESLKSHLRPRQLLLLLDNFEQISPAAPLVAQLLSAAPQLKVLITSRNRLQLYGEQEFEVPPLPLPDLEQKPSLAELEQSPAVRLFVERSQTVKPEFTLTTENAAAIAKICIHLDGLPLAIELAAARSKLFSPAAFLKRLENRLNTLVSGPCDLPDRHRSLRAMLDWSYNLLKPAEQLLFARLAVFVGGCTIETAEAICADIAGQTQDVLNVIVSLLDKSLLWHKDQPGGEVRVGMLEIIREYARERLEESGEANILRKRHAQHYLELAEEAELKLMGPDQAPWVERLESELDNIRAALQWALQQPGEDTALRLSTALYQFWQGQGLLSEGRKWLEAALSSSINASDLLAAKAYRAAGAIALYQGDYKWSTRFQEEGLKLLRKVDDKPGIAKAINNLGTIEMHQGHHERAAEFYQESLAIWKELDNIPTVAIILYNLGTLALYQRDYEQATLLLEESQQKSQEAGNKLLLAYILTALGHVLLGQAHYEQAENRIKEGLRIHQELQEKESVPWSLEGMAAVAELQGDWERAARLWGAAEGLRESVGAPTPLAEKEYYQMLLSATHSRLTAPEWAAAWDTGRAMSLEQAIAYALE